MVCVWEAALPCAEPDVLMRDGDKEMKLQTL